MIVAHCAMQGDFADLDQPMSRGPKPSFELFARLMDDAGLSRPALRRPVGGRAGRAPAGRARAPASRRRSGTRWLLNGSDYPGPGIVAVMGTKGLVEEGVLAAKDAERLGHIQQHNPLLFDFYLKRCLAWKGERWPARVFEPGRVFRRRVA